MDLTFSDSDMLLRTSILDVLEREVPKDRVLEIDDSELGYSPDLWKVFGGLGWPGMAVPPDLGGVGGSLVEQGILFECLGEFAVPSPQLTVSLSAHVLMETGNDAAAGPLLSGIAGDGKVIAFAHTEPAYRWSADGVSLAATTEGDTYVLTGTKLFIPDAHIADRLLVTCRLSDVPEGMDAFGLMLVDPSSPAVRVRRLSGWMSENMCEVVFEQVPVPSSALIAQGADGWNAVERGLDKTTALLCAYMAGGARRATDMAIEHSKTRVAFGAPIGTFQRVQDHVVAALNHADSMRWTAYEALWRLEEGSDEAAVAVSTAKALASVGFSAACDESHQVHAGIGTDMDFGLTQYTKRARTLQHYLGDALHHRRRLAGLFSLASPALR